MEVAHATTTLTIRASLPKGASSFRVAANFRYELRVVLFFNGFVRSIVRSHYVARRKQKTVVRAECSREFSARTRIFNASKRTFYAAVRATVPTVC